MNASQQAAVAPLSDSVVAGEFSAQNRSFGFQAEQSDVDLVDRLMQSGCELLRGDWARVHHPAGDHGKTGIVRAWRFAFGGVDRGFKCRIGIQSAEARQLFRRNPEVVTSNLGTSCAALLLKFVEICAPDLTRSRMIQSCQILWKRDQREQTIV